MFYAQSTGAVISGRLSHTDKIIHMHMHVLTRILYSFFVHLTFIPHRQNNTHAHARADTYFFIFFFCCVPLLRDKRVLVIIIFWQVQQDREAQRRQRLAASAVTIDTENNFPEPWSELGTAYVRINEKQSSKLPCVQPEVHRMTFEIWPWHDMTWHAVATMELIF